MRKYMITAFAGLLCLGASEAQARPVSYPGGTSVMIMNDADMNSVHIDYSPSTKYAVGYAAEYWREGDYTIQAVELNNLLKRWNNEDSQANLYLKSGIGVAIDDDQNDPAIFTGMAADWEDRRYFVSYENRYTQAGDIDDFYMQSGRVGVAPYVGEYGDVHTWLMLQVDHKPESEDQITVTPLVRVFKGTHLIEAGMSNKGKVLFNWVKQF